MHSEHFDSRRGRIHVTIHTGRVLIGGDAHYWPGKPSTAHRAFVSFAKEFKPKEIVLNGDVIDAPKISRHPSIGWEGTPEIFEEIEISQERTNEIVLSSPNSRLRWPLGNHDARFETFLANKVPEFKNIKGVHLKDHFPAWSPCWAVVYNGKLIVTHRFKGGVHAARTNVVASGMHYCTGHYHRLGVSAVTLDTGETLFGVEHGMLAAVDSPAFTGYTESNSLDWRSGFVMLTFEKGRLLWPEICHVVDERKGLVEWRGKVHSI